MKEALSRQRAGHSEDRRASLLLVGAGDTAHQGGCAQPPSCPHPRTSGSLFRTQPYPQGPLLPGTHPCLAFCLLEASPHHFWLEEVFIFQGNCRNESFFLLSNLTKERNKEIPTLARRWGLLKRPPHTASPIPALTYTSEAGNPPLHSNHRSCTRFLLTLSESPWCP